MSGEFSQGRVTNRLATDALRERDAAKARAATVNPNRDASAENVSRVKRSGNGPWTPQHGDSTAALNSKR